MITIVKASLLCAILLMVIFSTGCTNDDGPVVYESAPDFSLTDTDGEKISLGKYLGDVIILDFMATWCGPCVQEMGHLKRIHGNYKAEGVRIISIDVDNSETSKQLNDFKIAHDCDWQFAANGGSAGNTYGAESIPTIYIIDREGSIAFKEVGLTDYSVLAKELEKLV